MIPNALDKRAGSTALATSTSAVALTDASGAPLKLAYAGRWRLTIVPATEALTLVRYRRRGAADWPWSEWVTATGVTPAADAAGIIAIDGDCAYELDVEVTAAGTGTCAFYLVGV